MATPSPSPSNSPMPKQSPLIFHPISITVILFAMILLIPVTLWLCLTLQFPSFQVTSVTVTSLPTTPRTQLTASFQVNGTLTNTNIYDLILFESLHLVLWFNHHTLASAPVEPLPLSTGPDTDTPVKAQFPVPLKLFPLRIVKGIAQQRALGFVDFEVTLQGRFRFFWSGFMLYFNYSTVHVFELDCNHLLVFFSRDNNGTLVASRDCSPV